MSSKPPEAQLNLTHKGPIRIRGNFRLIGVSGAELSARVKEVSLCACGQSGNKPFCDGSHRKPI